MKIRDHQNNRIYTIIACVVGVSFNVALLSSPSYKNSLFNTLILSIGILLSFLLIIFNNFLDGRIKFSNVTWALSYAYIFPFSITLILLENQEDLLLHFYFLGSIFYFLEWENFKRNDWIIILSTGLAIIVNTLKQGALNLDPGLQRFYYCIVSFVLFSSYSQHKIAKRLGMQVQKLRLFGGAIAHELRTPLASVMAIAQVLKTNLPKVIKDYKNICEQINGSSNISPEQALIQSKLILEKTARGASLIIDMLLAKIKNESETVDYSIVCDSQTIIEVALNEYPLDKYQKNLVSFNFNNKFLFQTNPEAIKYVFFNLLKNSLYQINKHKRGSISIWLEQHINCNEIHFKDTAIGIKDEELPKLFEDFYSNSKRGTGIGLPFCRLVIENSNGAIICRSVFEEYTEFIIRLPKVKEAGLSETLSLSYEIR